MSAEGRYDPVAVALHWAIAVLALAQIGLGWWMLGIPDGAHALQAHWFNLHKSIGLTIGALMLGRLAWRLAHRPPPLPAALPRWQARAALANHRLLYALLIAQPLVGYLGSSFTRYPVLYFGWRLPRWGWESATLKGLFATLHFGLAVAICALVALHVAAALRHALAGDRVFGRMAPAVPAAGFALLVALALFAGAAHAAPFAYASNEKAGTVSVIDTATDRVVGELPAGHRPRGMAPSPDGRRLYVSDATANTLVVIDLAKREIAETIPIGRSPEGVDISPDGRWVIAAVELTNAVDFVDAASGKLAFSVHTEGKNPEHAQFSPDGRWVYASAEDADSVDVIDVGARRQVAAIKVGKRPRGIAFTPDGKRAYVACELASTVYDIDVAKREVLRSIPGGKFSNGVTMRPDGKRVFVSNGRDYTVSAIDTATDRVLATIPVGKRPWNMAITPDGGKLYVANGRSNSVSVIDAVRDVKLYDIPVGERPWGVIMRGSTSP